MTTMFLPAISGRPPTSSAAATAAPEEMPTGMPSSSRAACGRCRRRSRCRPSPPRRSRSGRGPSGTKPAPMPWILCGPGWPPERTGESSGSTATIRSDGLRGLSTWPTPVMVPPVPTPDDEDVDAAVGVVPDLLRRGAAVDLRIGRVLELLRDDRVGDLLQQFLGLGDGAASCRAGRGSAPAPRRAAPASCAARTTSSRASPGSAGSRAPPPTKASAMPVLPEVGSIRVRAGLDPPVAPPARRSC